MIINLILNQQNAEQTRHGISNLLTQMTANYQQAKPDRLTLKSVITLSTESFSILEELELVTSDLRGYANQIQTSGSIENSTTAINHLQNLRLFSILLIGQFYFETGEEYLRLLMLECLRSSTSI
jgi:hypothetical protein